MNTQLSTGARAFEDVVAGEYFAPLDVNGRRRDDERPKLSKGSVEFVAPTEYMVRPPMPPLYFFLIDVSLSSVRNGMLKAEKLSEFYEVCKNIDLGCGFKFPTLEQPPASFVSAMEEYVKDAPRTSSVRREKNEYVPKVLALKYKKKSEPQDDAPPPPPPPPELVKESVVPTQTVPSVTTDLLILKLLRGEGDDLTYWTKR